MREKKERRVKERRRSTRAARARCRATNAKMSVQVAAQGGGELWAKEACRRQK